ncbi:hypothetical protein DERF_014914 [Dermatophagoides farinae]|uniref:Uncharacterized protein n=1 Tax=Dermatophagoides farinae TaxID=6954 RepID=A0A922HQ67_DERFA|nr:hypothetical protein DERF_014914 [Dermatophagoides farinae]
MDVIIQNVFINFNAGHHHHHNSMNSESKKKTSVSMKLQFDLISLNDFDPISYFDCHLCTVLFCFC